MAAFLSGFGMVMERPSQRNQATMNVRANTAVSARAKHLFQLAARRSLPTAFPGFSSPALAMTTADGCRPELSSLAPPFGRAGTYLADTPGPVHRAKEYIKENLAGDLRVAKI